MHRYGCATWRGGCIIKCSSESKTHSSGEVIRDYFLATLLVALRLIRATNLMRPGSRRRSGHKRNFGQDTRVLLVCPTAFSP